jgi:Methyltransferase domain
MTGHLLRRAARTVRAGRALATTPPYVPPGHFYSPLTSAADVRRALSWPEEAPGVDLREEAQLALAGELRPVLAEALPGPRYQPVNDMFCAADAAVYRAMLDHLRPKRIIEVGSGFSTAVALDGGYAVTCIEPYPERLLSLIAQDDPVILIRQPVQDVALDFFGELSDGDVLFIDSTHVAKAGSDVCWLLLHVLPRLAPGVAVHVHDIFWPFTYPSAWLRERRDWNEAYLLHAFLSGNADWEIALFSSWLWRCHPEAVPPPLRTDCPGSIWLHKTS